MRCADASQAASVGAAASPNARAARSPTPSGSRDRNSDHGRPSSRPGADSSICDAAAFACTILPAPRDDASIMNTGSGRLASSASGKGVPPCTGACVAGAGAGPFVCALCRAISSARWRHSVQPMAAAAQASPIASSQGSAGGGSVALPASSACTARAKARPVASSAVIHAMPRVRPAVRPGPSAGFEAGRGMRRLYGARQLRHAPADPGETWLQFRLALPKATISGHASSRDSGYPLRGLALGPDGTRRAWAWPTMQHVDDGHDS